MQSLGRSPGPSPRRTLRPKPGLSVFFMGFGPGLFAFFMGFEDSCHVCDIVLHFSCSLIFAYNSEPGENLVQTKTEIFAPRDWQESFFTYFLQLTNPLTQLARLRNICGNELSYYHVVNIMPLSRKSVKEVVISFRCPHHSSCLRHNTCFKHLA